MTRNSFDRATWYTPTYIFWGFEETSSLTTAGCPRNIRIARAPGACRWLRPQSGRSCWRGWSGFHVALLRWPPFGTQWHSGPSAAGAHWRVLVSYLWYTASDTVWEKSHEKYMKFFSALNIRTFQDSNFVFFRQIQFYQPSPPHMNISKTNKLGFNLLNFILFAVVWAQKQRFGLGVQLSPVWDDPNKRCIIDALWFWECLKGNLINQNKLLLIKSIWKPSEVASLF